jgi:type IV pilus assembly protein PilV
VRVRSFGGFTLVEVLVALCVLSLGVLGAAAVQMKAHASRHQSELMSGATQLASALAERMRANPVAMAASDADNPYLQLDYDSSSGAPASPPVACYASAGCPPAALAAFDLYETTRILHDGFPAARLRVCRDAAPWDGPAGTLTWECDAALGAPIVIKIGWRGKAQAQGEQAFAPAVTLIAPGAQS